MKGKKTVYPKMKINVNFRWPKSIALFCIMNKKTNLPFSVFHTKIAYMYNDVTKQCRKLGYQIMYDIIET